MRKHGEDFMKRRRPNGRVMFSNNAWKLPRGIKENMISSYKKTKIACSPKDNYVLGWKPSMSNREVAKLVGNTKRQCFVRGIKVAYRNLLGRKKSNGLKWGATKKRTRKNRNTPNKPETVRHSKRTKRTPMKFIN